MTTQAKSLPPTASPRAAVAAILGVSVAATLFPLLAHLRASGRGRGQRKAHLPARAQRPAQRPQRHCPAHRLHLHPRAPYRGPSRRHVHRVRDSRRFSWSATSSTTPCTETCAIRPAQPSATAYLWLLSSHIILAIVALPLILTTFFFSLTGRIPMHRKIARWTFPIWLYVSVTGVITYVMLRLALG